MKLSRKQAGKRAWTAQRNAKAEGLRKYRFRPKFYRTPFGVVRYMTHPLFAAALLMLTFHWPAFTQLGQPSRPSFRNMPVELRG